MRRIWTFATLGWALVVGGCSPAETADGGSGGDGGQPEIGSSGDYTLDLEVDGIARQAWLHVPGTAIDAMREGSAPLLFALHNVGETGEGFADAAHLTELADQNAFVLVCPDAVNSGWFLESSEGWDSPDGYTTSLQNDLALMPAIIDLVGESYEVDLGAVFAVGFSRGAAMAGALATSSGQIETSSGLYSSPFAAHAVSAGFDVFDGNLPLATTTPKNPIWIVHGTDDAGVPYSDGQAFADDLEGAGWDITFTTVQGAGHEWLFQAGFGQSNQDLWSWLAAAAAG